MLYPEFRVVGAAPFLCWAPVTSGLCFRVRAPKPSAESEPPEQAGLIEVGERRFFCFFLKRQGQGRWRGSTPLWWSAAFAISNPVSGASRGPRWQSGSRPPGQGAGRSCGFFAGEGARRRPLQEPMQQMRQSGPQSPRPGRELCTRRRGGPLPPRAGRVAEPRGPRRALGPALLAGLQRAGWEASSSAGPRHLMLFPARETRAEKSETPPSTSASRPRDQSTKGGGRRERAWSRPAERARAREGAAWPGRGAPPPPPCAPRPGRSLGAGPRPPHLPPPGSQDCPGRRVGRPGPSDPAMVRRRRPRGSSPRA